MTPSVQALYAQEPEFDPQSSNKKLALGVWMCVCEREREGGCGCNPSTRKVEMGESL